MLYIKVVRRIKGKIVKFRNVLFCFSLIVLFFVSKSYCNDYPEVDYFPLQYGNQWDFQTIPIVTNLTMTWSISDTIRINNVKYHVFDGVPIRKDSSGAVWKYINDKDVLWFDFSINEDSTYNFEEYNLNFIVKVEKELTINSPIGEFNNCVRFSFNVPDIVDVASFYTFAPNIGPLQYSNSMNPYELYQATINGELISDVYYQTQKPHAFRIDQNYPNPFNSSTQIPFSIDSACNLKIEIYNINGDKIEILLDKFMTSGNHTLTWEASTYSTGLYFVYLKTNKQTRHIKILVIK